MTQTDAEIVARALLQGKTIGAISCRVEAWDGSRGRVEHAPVLSINYDELAAAVVAALTEAGRLVPDGCVAIDRATYDAALTLAWNTDADVHDALLSAVGDKTR